MGERKLCYGCMERTEFSGGVCPNCGYYDKSPSDPSFIIPGTQLNNRYIVGVALFVNGEGITYLAYDQSIGCKVYLREYMPPNLCNRVAGSPVISVIPARLAQYKALMATEGVNIEFTEDGIKRIAQAAWQVNETTENIGARRLHTVLERLVEDISYDASEMNGQTVTIDAEYVSKHLDVLVADEDLSRFIL